MNKDEKKLVSDQTNETQVHMSELSRIISDPKYHAVSFDDGENAIIDITAAMGDGVEFYANGTNRTHGRDEKATGKSLIEDGAQQHLNIIPVRVAHAAGILIRRFDADKKDDPISEDGFVVLDGHGRMNFLYSQKEEDRPRLFAHFVAPNMQKQIDSKKAFIKLNENSKAWKGEDYIIPRLLDAEDFRQQVWSDIKALLDKKYNFTAACEWVIFKRGNITRTEMNAVKNQDEAKSYMENMPFAKRIHSACVRTFGEGDDTTLKSKVFPENIISIWDGLLLKNNKEQATGIIENFINSIESGKVSEIISAKKTKYEAKDVVRKKIMNTLFNKYCEDNGI